MKLSLDLFLEEIQSDKNHSKDDYEDKAATLVGQEKGFFGTSFKWKVDDTGEIIKTSWHKDSEFKNAKPGTKAIIHWNPGGKSWMAMPVNSNK